MQNPPSPPYQGGTIQIYNRSFPRYTHGMKELDYTIKRHKTTRALRLRIGSDGALCVTAPWYVPEFVIHSFVNSKADWIENHRTHLTPKRTGIPEKVCLFGKETLEIKIVEAHQKNPVIKKYEKSLRIGISPLTQNREKSVLDALQTFYKEEAECYFAERLPHFAQMIGVQYQQYTVKNQSTRWGSCSALGNINLNVRLIHEPKDVIDYVIVHELCHLKEMNHSAAFWRLVASVCPNYKILRGWMKTMKTQ